MKPVLPFLAYHPLQGMWGKGEKVNKTLSKNFLRKSVSHTDDQQAHEKMLNITNYFKNSNQNYNEVSPHQSEWPSLKNLQITNARKSMEKREPFYDIDGNVNSCSQSGEQYGGSSKN